jgi:hypothetical protein
MRYLDAVFPYLKEAATDKNGKIWMLPLDVNIAAIVYHELNCLDAGIDFTANTIDALIENVSKTYAHNPEMTIITHCNII